MEELKKEIIDEKSGITYTLIGDYYYPNLYISKDTNYIIGKYGLAHLKYIEKYNIPLCTELRLNGKLNTYLHSVDENCKKLLDSIIIEFAKKENVTEELKANNQLEWVSRMNNIKARAEEIIYSEVIYV